MTSLSSAGASSIAVVGSVNLDIVVPVARHPRVGETVLGGDHYRAPGGKGANQAVACARLGAATRFVGCIGDDDAGVELRRALIDNDVEVTNLVTLEDTPSGIALIVVDERGENTIVVSPGANERLTAAHIDAAALGSSAAVLLQLEVPVATVAAAAAAAKGLVVLNPAPATTLPPELLDRTDLLVPNRSELAILAGAEREATTIDEVADLARLVVGSSLLVVTLGSDGALIVDGGEVRHVPAPSVTAIDTTAAGDSFCAALTVAIAEGARLEAAVEWATSVAAVTVTRKGAQPSLPKRGELEHQLERGGEEE